MTDPLSVARAALAEYDAEAQRRTAAKVPPPSADHLRAALAAYDDAADGLDKWRRYCEGARETVARLDAALAALRIEHAAHAALLDVTRADRDRLRVAGRAVLAVWDGEYESDPMAPAIDKLRGALAGREGS